MKVNIVECPKKPLANALHLSFEEADINWFVGEKLRAAKPCNCPSLSHGSEATAFYVALYKYICVNMNKKGILTCSDFKVGDNFNMMFASSVNLKRMFLVVSKTLKSIAGCYPFYDREIFNLNGKAKRTEFNYYVKRIKFSLTVMVDKKNADKLKGTFEEPEMPVLAEVSKPASLSETKVSTNYMLLKCDSWTATLLAKMLSDLYKLSCLPSSDGVIVYGESNYKRKTSNISKDGIAKYLDLMYGKSGFKNFGLNVKWTLLSTASDIPATVGSVDAVAAVMDKAL